MSDTDKNPRSEAVDDMLESVQAFTYDGDRSSLDHFSGAPEERGLVLGDEDPRDAALAERPLTEDVAWTGRIFNVDRLRVELPDGRHFLADLMGLEVRDADTGAVLGTVTDILTPPAHEVYVVRGGGREYLIPAVDEFVKEIDVDGGFIRVSLIEGMGSEV